MLLLAFSGIIQLCLSPQVFAEYDKVTRRPRFRRAPEVIEEMLEFIAKAAYWIAANTMVRACPDPNDDIFLECAEAAEAHYLITGNPRHFRRKRKQTEIVSPRDFLELMAGAQRPQRAT